MTAEVIERLRARADAGAPADFRRDIWPMIDQEVRTVYYATLVRERRCTCDAEEFTATFATADPADVPLSGDPLAIEESDAQRNVLSQVRDRSRPGLGLAEDHGALHRRRRRLDRTVPQLATVLRGHGSPGGRQGERDRAAQGRPGRAARPAQRDPVARRPRRPVWRLLPGRTAALVHAAERLSVDRAARRTHRAVRRPHGCRRARGARPGPAGRVLGRTVRRAVRSLPGPHRAGCHADRGAPSGNRPAPHDRSAAADIAGPRRVPAVPHPDPRRRSLGRGRCRGHPASIPAAGHRGSPARTAFRVRRAHRVGALGDRGGHPPRASTP